jgi:glycosyltransferase involved in cell wall biosynthesis
VDSAPQKPEWKITFSNADVIVPYTEWAQKTLLKECKSTINLFPLIANAGINKDEFYPVTNKQQHKLKFFKKPYNIIGAVMRNQRRKLLADMMLMFRRFLDKPDSPKDTILYLHTSYPEDIGWDLPSLLMEYNVTDKVYFTYKCKLCSKFFPSKFKGVVTQCPYCQKPSAVFANPTNGVTTAELNEIYNLFDIYVQYAICEGFGMPQIEAGACGIPIAAVDYSAMSEIIKNLDGYAIPCSLYREMETNALRALPDNDFTANLMLQFFNTDKYNDRSLSIRNKCIDKYSWDNVYKVWEACFDSVNINAKLPWDSNEIDQTYQGGVSVPPGLSKTEFIEFICNNIINEPYLLNTAPIKTLMKDFSNGYLAQQGSIRGIDHEYVIGILESFINNKNMCETMRLNKDTIIKEDFIP